MPDRITAQQVVDRIRENLGVSWKDSAIDVFSAGRPDTPITGIATAFAPSLKVLRQAVAANRNMIIAREHVFYNHGRSPAGQLPERLREDPACVIKQELIARHNLVVWRLSENWDRRKDDPQLEALAKALGWVERRTRGEFFTLPPDTIGNIAAGIRRRLNLNAVRVIGDPRTKAGKVALTHGLMLVSQLRAILREPGVDLVVIGEPVEWEATPYFQDVVASGQKKGMIVLGQAASEEPGCGKMAAWLKTVVPGIPVEWLPAGDPFRTLERRPL